MENNMDVPKELKIELPYHPAVQLLSIYSKVLKAGSWRDICTPVFITALFTIPKRWKQPKCPSTDEWIKKMCLIHKMEYYAALKKERNPVTCYNMDEHWGLYVKWISESQRVNTVWVHSYEVCKVVKIKQKESIKLFTKG